jgi:hypothetical protein
MTQTYQKTHGIANPINLPVSRKCKVVYQKDGAGYKSERIIDTPVSKDALHAALLKIGVALRQLVRVERV